MSLMMMMMVIVGTTTSSNWSESECRPAGSNKRFWVFGSQHKTGTLLLERVMRKLHVTHVMNQGPCCWGHDGETRPGGFVTRIDHVPEGHAAQFWHLTIKDDDMASLFRETQRRQKELRVVFFVRDPVDILVSGYFYHTHCTEKWVRDVPMRDQPIFIDLADRCHDPTTGRIHDAALCVLNHYVFTNSTYQNMLNAVDLQLGLVIEAIGAFDMLSDLVDTVRVLRQHPQVARVYDLANVTKSIGAFDRAFADIFSFLGVNNVSACVALASHFDVLTQSKHPAEGHAMPSSLSYLRDTLRPLLLQLRWFNDTIRPIRIALGYDDGGSGEPPSKISHL